MCLIRYLSCMRIKRNYALVMALVCLLAVAVSALRIYLYNPSLFIEQRPTIGDGLTNGYLLTLSLTGWLVVIGILGLGRLLRDYHQPKWIRYSIWINLAVNIMSGVVATVVIYTFHWSSLANMHRVLPAMAKFYMLFAFLFVRHRDIQLYFIVFAIINGVTAAIPEIGNYLLQSYSVRWLSLNYSILSMLNILPLLALYVHLYLIARRSPANSSMDDLLANDYDRHQSAATVTDRT